MKGISRILATGIVVILVGLAIWGWLILSSGVSEGAEGPWGGVDVTVIEQYAIDAGREAREPFINTDQGDMLLFVFALGGAVGGFTAGYFWRRLVSEKADRQGSAG
jgi:hypothetical protein